MLGQWTLSISDLEDVRDLYDSGRSHSLHQCQHKPCRRRTQLLVGPTGVRVFSDAAYLTSWRMVMESRNVLSLRRCGTPIAMRLPTGIPA